MEDSRNKKTTYFIKHCTENRFFKDFNKDYWKQWSTEIGAKEFTDFNEALNVLNHLNKQIIDTNPRDKRKHTIV